VDGLHTRAGQPGQGERREPAADVRLDGDEMTADADDGDAGHATAAYIRQLQPHRARHQWTTRKA
jgi:hypothetical protein